LKEKIVGTGRDDTIVGTGRDLPLRKKRIPNRLHGYDYSSPGWYFITICTKNLAKWFGNITNGKMELNQFGQIAGKQWMWLQNQYNYVKLDAFIIMPNHIHGILIIENDNIIYGVGTGRGDTIAGTGRDLPIRKKRKIKSLSELIGAYKTTSSKLIHQSELSEFSWQRSFYDHIIRNEKSLQNIREYIQNNLLKWEFDKNNPENLYM